MSRSCALTGHRHLQADFDENVLSDTLEQLIKEGCHKFYCGMALGFDLTALSYLLKLKKKYEITIEACIPFAGQERFFSEEDKQLYRELLEGCDQKTVLSEKYFNGCYMVRNRYMVDNSEIILAYCRQNSGGTVYTVEYARKSGKTIYFL